MKRLVVGAHYGLRDWLAQRITAAIMAVYTLILVMGAALNKAPMTHCYVWKDLFADRAGCASPRCCSPRASPCTPGWASF